MPHGLRSKLPIPNDPSVHLSVAAYWGGSPRRVPSLACLLHSLEAQTYPHWSATVVHDGPVPRSLEPAWDELKHLDPRRVRLVETPERQGAWGHHRRREFALNPAADFVGFSNDDNYYCPVYFEELLHALSGGAGLAYCDMVHSHRGWAVIRARPERGFMDVGNWLCRQGLVRDTPWTDFSFAADWRYFKKVSDKAKPVHVPGAFFVHN